VLDSGIPAQTTDQLETKFARYSQVVSTDWYAGVQIIPLNYTIGAASQLSASVSIASDACLSPGPTIKRLWA